MIWVLYLIKPNPEPSFAPGDAFKNSVKIYKESLAARQLLTKANMPAMKSIEVTLRLLEALVESKYGLSVNDIARKVSFGKSTTHRALQALAREQYAIQDPITNRYKPGPAILNIAFNYISDFKLRRLARPILRRIVDAINENVYLCVFVNETLYFVDRIESNHPIRYVNPMGKRQFLHAGAPGKAILAYLPHDHIESVIAKGLPKYTDYTITDPEKLRQELINIRKLGYATSASEFAVGGNAIAVPFFNSNGLPIGCIDLVIPKERYEQNDIGRYVALLKEGVRELQEISQKFEGGLDFLL